MSARDLLRLAYETLRKFRSYYITDNRLGLDPAANAEVRLADDVLAKLKAALERPEPQRAASLLGSRGRGSSKRRDVDYAALGAKGGAAGKGKKKPRRNSKPGTIPRGRPPKS